MKTLEEIREGYASAAQRKAVWAARNDAKKEDKFNAQDMVAHDSKKVHKTRKEDSDAVKAFLAKGGKIKKLPPAKAQGYHGKDDPGQDVKGIMNRDDSKAIGTRKKVKSMEDDDTARMYKDNPKMMKQAGPGGYKGLNKTGKKAVKKAMGEAVKPTRAMHVFDNEKDARAKAKEIGGKYVKGTGKSMGKHAAIKEDISKVPSSRLKYHATKGMQHGRYTNKEIDAEHKRRQRVEPNYNSVKPSLNNEGNEKPPFDPPYRKAGEPRKDQFGNTVKNLPRHLARKAARDLVKKKQNNEANLDELSYDKMNKYYDAAKKSKDRATNSAVATILRKGDHSQDLKTRAKRIKGMDLAKTRSIKKIRGDK